MVQWSLASPYGIQRDDAGDVWHAGHVNDVLALDDGSIVVAADKGGIWHISDAGDGTALSDAWDNPDVLSLTFGPDGNRHVYASSGELNGKGALWATNPVAAGPLLDWHKIPVPDATRGITRAVALPGNRQIVIAAQRGLWRSPIPLDLNPLGYQWVQVEGLPHLAGDVWAEVAAGPDESVVAAIPGHGLFFGTWVAGALQMQPGNTPGLNPADFGRTSIASCAASRQILYAVVEKDENLFAVLSSGDGGRRWQVLAAQVLGQPPGTTLASPNQAGDQGSYNNCIAVSPADSAVVAIGWRVALFLSQDSGATWQKVDVVNQVPFHPDLHAVYFAPPDGHRLFVGSDGGIVAADVVLGPPDQPWLQNMASAFNRGLATLQFSGWPTRVAWATFSVNNQFAAGGLQDNGNVYSRWRDRSPWRQAGDSDGQLTLLLSEVDLLFDNTSDHTHPTIATWNGAQMTEKGVVPLWRDDGGVDPGGVTGLGSPKELFVEPVRASVLPSRHSPAFRILAVAGVGDSVYGLFNDDQADIFHHWEPLGNIGLTPNDFVTAIASFDGRAVFIASDAGRMFWLHPADGAQADVSPGGVGRVTRILVNASAGPALRGFSRADNTVLQLTGASADGPAGNWAVLGPVNAAGDTVFDIAVDWSAEPPRVFAATDARVFTTLDGRHWDSVSQGLPEDPHCAGLQVAGDYVFLSTFGRSMWRLPLDPCQPIVDAINDLENQISAREDDLSSIGGEVPPAERARIEAALRAEIRRLGQQLTNEERLLQDCRRTHGTRM